MPTPATQPRGRHAPPIEVRRSLQRRRIFAAAAIVFSRAGFAEATAEAISREAGMSKATFYERFANKEECLLEMFDDARAAALAAMNAAGDAAGTDPGARLRARIRAFLALLAKYPHEAQTLLVEVIGAGPRGAARRDAIVEGFAEAIGADDPRDGPAARDAAVAIAGAVVELASDRIRHGRAAEVPQLEPLIERLIVGLAPTAGG